METLFRDVRFGMRMLLKMPGFNFVVVLALALGIGANTAVFTLVNALLLKMLPIKAPRELVGWRSGARQRSLERKAIL